MDDIANNASKAAATTVKTAAKVALWANPKLWLVLIIGGVIAAILAIGLVITLFSGSDKSFDTGGGITGTMQVSESVLRWQSAVEEYAAQYGLDQYVGILMAMIQQESGGNALDVMQSSESLGLPPNSITDPIYSIEVGIKHFAAVYKSADGDIKLALQAYNFGGGFIDYANKHGGYSPEVAKAFSDMMAAKMGWARYGDPEYVQHVLQYYQLGEGADVPVVVSEGQSFDVQKAVNIISQYMGTPYYFGGRSPKAPGFDCSGILEYAFGKMGIDFSGTAASQYNKTVPIDESQIEPGDFIFFSTYKPGPSHVGMYIGNGQFINASSSHGVSIASVDVWKGLPPKEAKFLGFRRLVR